MDTIEVRVERGFAFLTERLGPGWWDAVDVDRLRLSDCFACVLGQLAPALGAVNVPTYAEYRMGCGVDTPYELACQALGWDGEGWDGEESDYGFDREESDYYGFDRASSDASYEVLTVAWRRRILAARDEAPAVTARAAEAVTM